MDIFLPIFLILVFGISLFTHIPFLDTFSKGALKGLEVIKKVVPYYLFMSLWIELMIKSGLLQHISENITILPSELLLQFLIHPFSFGGSLSVMLRIFEMYGVDSKMGICSSILQYSTDTFFYVFLLYTSSIHWVMKKKEVFFIIFVELSSFLYLLFLYYFCLN